MARARIVISQGEGIRFERSLGRCSIQFEYKANGVRGSMIISVIVRKTAEGNGFLPKIGSTDKLIFARFAAAKDRLVEIAASRARETGRAFHLVRIAAAFNNGG